jgi:transcriptional regulator with XRE-family HTH domain
MIKNGQDFYDWRIRLNLTQQQVCDILGFKNRSSVSRFENGHAAINQRLAFMCDIIEKQIETNTMEIKIGKRKYHKSKLSS